jgi:tRNA pseudouridine38-40 synthase
LAEATVQFSERPLPPEQRIALCVEYDGGAFSGWQSQSGVDTVQDALEAALGRVADHDMRVHCAGRTDTGVHALQQWVHFDAPTSRSLKAWVLGSNAHLPLSVRVVHALPVSVDFHARHSALARRYRYLIANTEIASALCHGRATWCRAPLDAGRMHRAAQSLLGEQDFSAFRAASCQSSTPMRCVSAVAVSRAGPLVAIDITANAFLHHMVRNIAGSLMAVGAGRREESWIAELMSTRDRTLAAATAPPDGLYLWSVTYPAQYGIPADLADRRAALFPA